MCWVPSDSTAQSILGEQPAATWGEKVGRTIEIARLQSIGNIDSCLYQGVRIPSFQRTQISEIALANSTGVP